MTIKERLHDLVERLDEAEADELLDYAGWLAQDADTLTDDELARAQLGQDAIARGDYVTLNDPRQQIGR